MPFHTNANNERRDRCVEDAFTVYLHKGDPGNNYTANRVSQLNAQTIAAGADKWNLTNGQAVLKANIEFGMPSADVNGVDWISFFKGASPYAKRQLAAPMNIVTTLPVIIAASSVVFQFTSSDA